MRITSQQFVRVKILDSMEELSILTSSITSLENRFPQNNAIELKYCKSEEMIADILTKGLGRIQFEKLDRYETII